MDQDSLLMPKESGRLIAKTAENVFINDGKIDDIAEKVLEKYRSNSSFTFSDKAQPPHSSVNIVDWIFVLDTLNYCFWSIDDSKKWKVEGESGYFALCAALKRAVREKVPITDAKFLSKLTKDDLKKILREDSNAIEIPLIDERVRYLNEGGQVLIREFNGSFENCIKQSENSAIKLLNTIVDKFTSYRDIATYRNYKVSFLKRAQILVADLWLYFDGKGFGEFHDIDQLTMFADYRVPQVLLHYGVLKYSDRLHKLLNNGQVLESGCTEEIEIRGCSIEAVERILTRVNEIIKNDKSLEKYQSKINSIFIDFFLWDYRRKHAEELNYLPFHKVRTIFY